MAKVKSDPQPRHARQNQARGVLRREKLLAAAAELLGEMAPDEISLAGIAERAGIPVGSAYHFYPTVRALYAVLAGCFSKDIYEIISQPYLESETTSWQRIIETAVVRVARYYDAHPEFRQLVLGDKTPPEIKRSDRLNDEFLGNTLIDIIQGHFEVPEFPNRTEVFFYTVEIVDLFFMLSQRRNGYISNEMCAEAQHAALSYLRGYLPEYLPRRLASKESTRPTPTAENHLTPEERP